MSNKIQKRLVTFEVISKGEKPVDLNDVVQDALISAVNNAINLTLNLNYERENGSLGKHEFVGIDIKEIK